MTDTSDPEVCREDGCSSPITKEDGLCPAHGEGGSEEMARRGREGGSTPQYRIHPDELPDELAGYEEVKALLSKALLGVATGEVKPKVGNTISRLARSWSELHESELTTERLEEIQERQKRLKEQVEKEKRQDDRPWT